MPQPRLRCPLPRRHPDPRRHPRSLPHWPHRRPRRPQRRASPARRASTLNALLVAGQPDGCATRTAHHARIVEAPTPGLRVRVYSNSLDIRFPVEAGGAVLDAAERAGHVITPTPAAAAAAPSYAAHLDAGETEMEEQYVLEPKPL